MKRYMYLCLTIFLGGLLFPTAVSAADQESLLMARSAKPFEATLDQLSAAISFSEYKVSRIQRVDVGLTKSGYKTEKYRLVFFGKAEEVNTLLDQYPQLAPFLPLKIVIFSEGEDTILLAMNPGQLVKLVPEKKLLGHYRQWEKDVKNILKSASSD